MRPDAAIGLWNPVVPVEAGAISRSCHAEHHAMAAVGTPTDLTRTFLVILIVAILIVGSLWTMWPFLGALLWAGTLVISTWPLMLSIQRLSGGSRAIATSLMTLLIAGIFIVPFVLAASVVLDSAIE